jgi:hypothetical protein
LAKPAVGQQLPVSDQKKKSATGLEPGDEVKGRLATFAIGVFV